MDKQKEPRLRFKGFTGAWEYKKFENVLSIKSGMSQKEIEVSDGIYPILATGGEIGRTNTALYDKESVLIGRKGTIDKPYYMNTPFWTVDTLFYSELKNNIDGKFLYFLFQCIEWRKLDTSTGVPSLTSTTIHEIQRYFPSKPEQIHLGLFFRRLDSQIAESRAVLEKSHQLKKAMLAKMFPANGEKIPKIRFKGFEGEWEEKGFESVGEFNPKTEIPQIFQYVDLESVVGTQLISYREEFKETAPSRAQRLAKNGDLFFQAVRPYQKNNYLFEKNNENFVFSTGYIQIRPRNDGYFLLTLVQKEEFVQEVLLRCTGTSYPAINASSLQDIAILIPQTSKEQTAIGNFFRQLDETIALQSAEVEKLNQLKKGLLSAMLV